MLRKLLTALVILALTSAAQAQPPAPRPPIRPAASPGFSPYLNLLRRGNPAFNYYGLVRPELEFRRSIQYLQQDVASIRSTGETIQAEVEGLRPTGHPVRFLNLSNYFPAPGAPPITGQTGRRPTRPVTRPIGR